jgi:hypothetical protein
MPNWAKTLRNISIPRHMIRDVRADMKLPGYMENYLVYRNFISVTTVIIFI